MSHAVCACRNLNVNGLVSVDALDWTGGMRTSVSGAALGVNGSATPDVFLSIDGSLVFGGSEPLSFAGLTVSGDLKLATEASSTGSVKVGRDLWLGGPFSTPELRVARDVYLGPAASIQTSDSEEVGGSRFVNAPAIAPPCRCADSSIELTEWIEQARLQNDNASIGLAPDPPLSGALRTDLTLPCGRFYLSSMESLLQITLRVTGRAALFVAGDVESPGHFEVVLEPGAELDWFVGGSLRLGVGRVGDAQRAGALRIYVAGEGTIDLPASVFAGNLHAPNSDVSLLGEMAGSVLARDVSLVSPLLNSIHYDRSVLTAGDGCSEVAVTDCQGCGDCGKGLTCLNGSCSSCSSDQDCCAPLVCQSGRCEPLVGMSN
jgi:hypothetical protein